VAIIKVAGGLQSDAPQGTLQWFIDNAAIPQGQGVTDGGLTSGANLSIDDATSGGTFDRQQAAIGMVQRFQEQGISDPNALGSQLPSTRSGLSGFIAKNAKPIVLGAAGLAGGLALGGVGAGAGATGTEAASTFGAGGEFAGAGASNAGIAGTTLAEQSAGIGSGSAAGTAAGTGVGTGVGGTAVTGAGTAATGTALQRILDGSGTTQDYLTLAGQVAPSLLGMHASNEQTDALTRLADRNFEIGAPFRSRLAEISEDPNLFYDSPQAKQATESVLRRLSATHGNVAGSPYGQALTIDALAGQFGQERDRLANFGGLTAFNQAAPGSATAAIGSQANFFNALGGGIADVTTPRRQNMTLSEILRAGGY